MFSAVPVAARLDRFNTVPSDQANIDVCYSGQLTNKKAPQRGAFLFGRTRSLSATVLLR
jgi:hypothetical protein